VKDLREGRVESEAAVRLQTYNATLTDYLLVPLPSIQCNLPLRDVYDRVTFEEIE
jgi:hypothetical protein